MTTGLGESARHRLAFKTLAATVHLYACTVCGAEPIVSLDGEHNPILVCRTHGAEPVRALHVASEQPQRSTRSDR